MAGIILHGTQGSVASPCVQLLYSRNASSEGIYYHYLQIILSYTPNCRNCVILREATYG